MRKRVFSLCMALAMVMSLFATPAIAEETVYPDAPSFEASNKWVDDSGVPSTETEPHETATDEMESLDAQAFQALLLDGGMASYTIGYMETYVYENIGDIAYKVSTRGYSDYVIYNADGSVQDYGWGRSGATYTVSAGGKIAVTSINTNGLSCAALSDFFTAAKRDTPAMLRKSLANGETFTYTNAGALPYKLFTSGYSDYVLYGADGSVQDYGWGRSGATYTVPAGGKIAVTSINTNGLSCAAIYDFFTAAKRDTPAMLRKSLANGETFTYTNNGALPYKLFTSGYSDYVLYNADGSVKENGSGRSGATYTVPAGGKIALTSTNTNGLSCAGIYDFFAAPQTVIVEVTGISLNKSVLSLSVGFSEKLTATVIPANATNKNVKWTSSDTSVATVDSGGAITAKAAGTATISVTTLDGNKTAACVVSVSSAPSPTVTQIVVENRVVFPNSEFAVPVMIKNNPGIAGATLTISYDKSALTLNNITKGALFEKGSYNANSESGVVQWYHTENVTDDGVLFALQFTVNESAQNGSYNIAVGLRDGIPANLSDADSNIVNAQFISGALEITAGIRGDVTGDGVIAINDVVKLARAVAGSLTLTEAEIALADVTGDGVIAINDVVKLARYVAGNLASLQRADHASLSGGESVVIEVATVSGKPGETVRVPVSIISNPGIAGAQLDVSSDNGLILKNVIKGDILSGENFTPDVSAGRIQWYYSEGNVTNTGILFTLEFEVSSEAQNGDAYAVTVNVKDRITANLSDYNANPVNAEFKPGKIQISENAVINTVSRNGNTITANVVCADSNASVFCGAYNNSGKMISIRSAQVASDSNYEFRFEGQPFDYAKVFIVDSGFRPLCEGKRT